METTVQNIFDLVAGRIIARNFGVTNLVPVKSEHKNSDKKIELVDYVIETRKQDSENATAYVTRRFELTNNRELGIFAFAIDKLEVYITVKVELLKDSKHLESRFKFFGDASVRYSYSHINGGDNGCSTDLDYKYIASNWGEDEGGLTLNDLTR